MKTFLSNSLIIGICAFIVGCPGTTKLADRTIAAANREASAYGQYDRLRNTSGERAVNALTHWANELIALNSAVSTVVRRVRNNEEKRAEIAGELNTIQGKLDLIFARRIDSIIKVPSWQMGGANRAVLRANQTLRALQENYRKLYGTEPDISGINIRAAIDHRYYDTYNDCVNAITERTDTDIYAQWCMEKARANCGHQIDMDCLVEFIQNSKTTALQNDDILPVSACAHRYWGTQYNYETGETDSIELNRVESWLDQISSCRSATPIFR